MPRRLFPRYLIKPFPVENHVIVLNEGHLKRLMTAYVRYYHEDRTHLALEKNACGSHDSGLNHLICPAMMPRTNNTCLASTTLSG